MAPDGKIVYLLVPDAAKEEIYRVAAEGGKPALVIEPSTGGYTSLQIPEKTAKTVLLAGYGSSVSPTEIVRVDVAQKTHVNLTHVNTAAAAAIDWQAPQHFYFTSTKGRNIHNMIVLPPALLRNSLAILPSSTARTGVFRGARISTAS